MNEHTPGPWWDESGIIHAKSAEWTAENHSCVHIAAVQWLDDFSESEANANLIAAAPDLLAACKTAVKKCPFPVGAALAKEKLQNAIAKAEGGEV